MAEIYDLLLRGGTLVSTTGEETADIALKGGRIAAIGDMSSARAKETRMITGLHVLPGVMDTQVHFREPGTGDAETLESGSRAAVKGGVTCVFEMPNTNPPTTTPQAMRDKLRRASGRMFCDYAFYAGGTGDNLKHLAQMETMTGCCGTKIFMGSSTGTLLAAEDETVAAILSRLTRRASIHSEDEARLQARRKFAAADDVHTHPLWRDTQTAYRSTARLLKIAKRLKRHVHVLHISTAGEIPLLQRYKNIASAEVTPQHLTLSAPDCYDKLGTFAQMNPPLRGAHHRRALWEAVRRGRIHVIGSDHAPHSRAAKKKRYPNTPSGMPGVQTLVPIMLTHVNAGRLSLQRFVDMTSATPARLFGIQNKGRLARGLDADLTLVDMRAKRRITDSDMESICGWTPYAGRIAHGVPVGTIIRGHIVMWEGVIDAKARGRPIAFA